MSDEIIKRHPIFISHNTVLVITEFRATNSLSDLWLDDYIDCRKEVKTAAQDLVDAIKDNCSIRMLWSLRETLANEIHNINKKRGTNFPIDNPDTE